MGRRSKGNDVVIEVILKDRNFQAKMRMMAKETLRTAAAQDKLEKSAKKTSAATDRLGKSTKKTGKELFNTSKRTSFLGRVFKRLATNIIAVAAAAIGIQKAIRVFRSMTEETRKFSKQMGQVATITKLNTAEFRSLTQQVLSLSRSLPKTADDLGLGLYQAISAGITDVAEAFEVMRASAVLASAGMVETGDAVKLVTTVLNAYNLPASQAEHITDVFFETVRRGVTTVPELAANFGTLATSASLVGITMEEAAAGFATMTRQGINSARAATSLNRFFIALADVSPEVQAAASDMGIEFSRMGVALAGGLLPWMKKLQEVTGGNIGALAELSPNIRAALTAFVLAGSGAEGFARDMEGMADVADSTADAMDKVRLTIDQRFVQIASRFKQELIEVGEVVLPGILDGMEAVLNFFETDIEKVVRQLRDSGADEGVIRSLQEGARMVELTSQVHDYSDAFRDLANDAPGWWAKIVQGGKDVFRGTIGTLFVGPTQGGQASAQISRFIEDAFADVDIKDMSALDTLMDQLAERLDEMVLQLGADAQAELAPIIRFTGDFSDLPAIDPSQIRQLGDTIADLPGLSVVGDDFGSQLVELGHAIGLVQSLKDAQEELLSIREREDLPDGKVLTDAEKQRLILAEELAATNRRIAVQTKNAMRDVAKIVASMGQVRLEFFDLTAEKDKLQQFADEIAEILGIDEFTGDADQLLAIGRVDDDDGKLEALVGRYIGLSDALRTFAGAVGDAERAQRRLKLQGDQSLKDTEAQERAALQLARAAAGVAAAMRDTTDAVEDLGNRWRDLADVVDGITRIADAFGILDDNLRKVLDGAGSLFDSLDKLSELKPGEGFGDLKLGEQLQFAGGAASIAAGVIGGIASLFGGESAAEAAQRQIDAMKSLRDSLDRLRDAVQKGADVSVAELARANAAAALLNDARADARNDPRAGNRARVGLRNRIAADTPEGKALRQAILDLEKTLDGIDLSGLFEGTGDEMRAAFDLFIANLAELNDGFGAFNDQFSGQTALFQLTMDQFDITEPIKQLEKFIDMIVKEFSPALAASIADFDLSTAEGRAELDQFIADLALSIAQGGDSSMFDSDLTNAEILAILGSIDGFLDLLQSDAGDDGQSFSRNVQITEARAGRLLAMTATMVTLDARLVDLAVSRNAALDGILAGLAATASAGAAPPTTSASTQAPSSTVTVGDIQVTVEVDANADAQSVGEEVGVAVLESIDQGLRERGLNSARAMGVN